MRKPQFHRIVGIAATAGILTAALCLMGGCGYLFLSDGGYSRERVAAVFRVIGFPVYLGLCLAALGALQEAFKPRKRKRHCAVRQDWLILRRLRKTAELTACPKALRQDILREQRNQRMRRCILLVPATLTWSMLAWHLLSGDRLSREDINGSVLGCLGSLLPGLALWLGWTLAVLRKNSESCRREIELLKQVAVSEKAAASRSSLPYSRYLRYPLLALAIFLLVWGLYLGGAADVLTKAINICTECVGLG